MTQAAGVMHENLETSLIYQTVPLSLVLNGTCHTRFFSQTAACTKHYGLKSILKELNLLSVVLVVLKSGTLLSAPPERQSQNWERLTSTKRSDVGVPLFFFEVQRPPRKIFLILWGDF